MDLIRVFEQKYGPFSRKDSQEIMGLAKYLTVILTYYRDHNVQSPPAPPFTSNRIFSAALAIAKCPGMRAKEYQNWAWDIFTSACGLRVSDSQNISGISDVDLLESSIESLCVSSDTLDGIKVCQYFHDLSYLINVKEYAAPFFQLMAGLQINDYMQIQSWEVNSTLLQASVLMHDAAINKKYVRLQSRADSLFQEYADLQTPYTVELKSCAIIAKPDSKMARCCARNFPNISCIVELPMQMEETTRFIIDGDSFTPAECVSIYDRLHDRYSSVYILRTNTAHELLALIQA